MKTSLFVAGMALAMIQGLNSRLARADELFSRISMDAVPSSPASAEKTTSAADAETPERGKRVLSLGELADILKTAGFEPQNHDDKFLSTSYQHSRWNFPVALSISPDYERIHVSFFLTQFDAQKQPTADRLLSLLAANRKIQPMFFSYVEERRQVELSTSFPNGEVGPRMMQTMMENLSRIAEDTAPLWEIDGKSAASLVGKWSAARSAAEAFAMQLNSDGSFALISVKGDQQSRSSGKFSVGGGQLTLAGNDGRKLAGRLESLSSDKFEFTPPGSAGKLTFTRAR